MAKRRKRSHKQFSHGMRLTFENQEMVISSGNIDGKIGIFTNDDFMMFSEIELRHLTTSIVEFLEMKKKFS